MRICKYCGNKVAENGTLVDTCWTCQLKKKDVHELYMTCQLVRKKLNMSYDLTLDREIKDRKWR